MKENADFASCGSRRTIEGRYLGQTDSGLFGHVFRPGGLKTITLTGSDISLSAKFHACLDCGLLWTEIDKAKLTTVLQKHGKKSTKDRLEL